MGKTKNLALFLFSLTALLCHALPYGALKIVSDEGLAPDVKLYDGAQAINGALQFSGQTGCRGSFALPEAFANTREFSISCWFRLDETPRMDLSPEGKRDCAAPFSRNWGFSVRISPSMDIFSRICLTDGSSRDLGKGKYTAPLNEWVHVVITYSASQKAYRFYVNGALMEEATGNAFPVCRLDTAPMDLGSDSSSYNAFPGALAGVAVFPRGLDSAEVLELYQEIPCAIQGVFQANVQAFLQEIDQMDSAGFSAEALEELSALRKEATEILAMEDTSGVIRLAACKQRYENALKGYPAALEQIRLWADQMADANGTLPQRVKILAENAPLALEAYVRRLAPAMAAWQADALMDDETLCYVVPPTSATPILPDSFLPVSQLGRKLTCSLTPGEYEGVSFVLKPLQPMTNVRFVMPDLADPQGNVLRADHLDFKHVLCWYQAGSAWRSVEQGAAVRILVPELMVNDPELVKVDYANQTDYVKLHTPYGIRYACATHSEARDPRSRWELEITNADYPVQDAPAPLPTDLAQDQNRQFIITVHADPETLPGVYAGEIRVLSDQGELKPIAIQVTVLPFTLETPRTNYDLDREFHVSIYQVSTMLSDSPGVISPFGRTPEQYRAELMDLASHGITNPLFYQYQTHLGHPVSMEDFKTALQMRQEAGLRNCPLFLSGPEANLQMGTEVTAENIGKFRDTANMLLDAVEEVTGHREVYFYGIDEAGTPVLRKERPVWDEFHNLGAKVLVSSCDTQSVFHEVGDILDLLVHCRKPSAKEAELWHSTGKIIFSYGNPQGGVEDPDAYRRNYGLFLYLQNYDGSCTYSNYEAFGNPWDDFDHRDYRDHNLVYPTVDGVVDTIAYEGLREAADDVKYATTMRLAARKARETGNAALADEAEAWLQNLDTLHCDLDQARATMVEYILKLQ